jgi:peptidoglycan glycosyltransferase
VGTAAVYNYKTGEILCAVTTPTYDPDNIPDIAGDTTGSYTGVYVNRFLQSKYIPGSIFKIVTLAAALESVPDIEERTFTCEGKYVIQNGDITCLGIHGTQTLKECFANSCNCAFAQIVELIGRDKLQRYVELFGVTDSVSFDGITTATGNFDLTAATAEQVAWSGIGQHKDQINPCAFLRFVGTIANGGIGAQPYVVSEVSVGNKTNYSAETTYTDRVVSEETARTIMEYMGNNVEVKYGAENFPNLSVCAKSGTGEVGGGKKPNAVFTGFVADDACPLAFIIVVEEGGFGTQTCMPIISQVLEVCARELKK